MANEAEPAAPWTIKAVPVRVREKAVRYARMDGVTMAEWLGRAVETEANRQDGNLVLPPLAAEVSDGTAVASVDFRPVAMAMQALAAVASAGLPVSKAAAREVVALLRSQARTARGLPPLKIRQTSGQTDRLHGQTVAGSHGVISGVNGIEVDVMRRIDAD